MLPRPRPEVHHVVGGANGLLVVLDHEHGVAEVAQALERVEEPPVVPLVKADRRLVEDVEHADQAGADLGGEPNALPLASRQRGRGPVQRQVLEAHLDEEPQPLADLLEHAARDRSLALGERERVEELAGGADREAHHVGDVPPGDVHGQGLGPEPRPRHAGHGSGMKCSTSWRLSSETSPCSGARGS